MFNFKTCQLSTVPNKIKILTWSKRTLHISGYPDSQFQNVGQYCKSYYLIEYNYNDILLHRLDGP